MHDFNEKLRESGFKLTPQRIAIANYLKGNTYHPTAARIYDDLKPQHPSMSMATVYNTLNTMVELGLVHEHKLSKDQVHYDPDLSPHHHFICRECKTVIDIPESGPLPKVVRDFQSKTKNRVDSASLVLTGICTHCS